jgi:hypothetical protein
MRPTTPVETGIAEQPEDVDPRTLDVLDLRLAVASAISLDHPGKSPFWKPAPS